MNKVQISAKQILGALRIQKYQPTPKCLNAKYNEILQAQAYRGLKIIAVA